MAAGDPQRAWFPEMFVDLKEKWSPSLTWDECISLCGELTEGRKQLRERKGIRGPRMKCKGCGGYHEMNPVPISVRSMLFALRKIKVIDEEDFEIKEKDWLRYQRRNKLNAYGNPKQQKQNKSAQAIP